MHPFISSRFARVTILALTVVLSVNTTTGTPSISPGLHTSSTTVKEAFNFSAIDSHVQRTPQHLSLQPLPRLVSYLIKPATNDIEKARAIARWITSNISYDFEAASLNSSSVSDNPDSVLYYRKALASGFATLFVRMMHIAGVEAFTISGFKKGFNFVPGDASTLKRHTWNAFRTGGKTYLVDLPVYKEVETDNSYILAYADAFFCIPPEQLIYTSFPDDKRWQCLSEPITKEQFINSVQCFGALHGYFITPLSHRQYTISSKQRTLTLCFDAPPSVILGARTYAHKDAKAQHSIVKTTREGRKFTVHIKFPADGTYKLEITATEHIRERSTNDIIGCSIKTLAEYNVLIGDKQLHSMALN
ncbi:MAG: transglutaminase domain-containing protein [Bacteroidota bacterium]|nr:hypothetical protein [Candidatus Kapabacteria bacterium]MDW8219232.1 transglutaminase domain-containing protein [Bacteroidota bacterium]